MRIVRFGPFAVQAARDAKTDAIADVQTFADIGYTAKPSGLVITLATGARVFVQFVGTSPPGGDWHEDPERIVEGEPLQPVEVPDVDTSGRKVRLPEFEAWLCAALANACHPEIQAVDPLSKVGHSHKYGARVKFHSGANAFGLLVHCLPAGAEPHERDEFKVLEVV